MIGLTSAEVERTKLVNGDNSITDFPTFRHAMLQLQEEKLLQVLLICCAVLFFIAGLKFPTLILLVITIGVIVINTSTTMVHWRKHLSLVNSDYNTVNVYRDGVVVKLPAKNLVVGDVVILQSGDMIPADGILVLGNIEVEHTSLTGYHHPCRKYCGPKKFFSKDIRFDEYSLYQGSIVTETFYGECCMEVLSVSKNTYFNRTFLAIKQKEGF